MTMPPDLEKVPDEEVSDSVTYVAKNEIKHGAGTAVDDDGKAYQDIRVFKVGDKIEGLDAETLAELLASDSIGVPDKVTGEALDENARLQQQVADLTAQLQVLLSNRTPQEQTGGQSTGAGGNLTI